MSNKPRNIPWVAKPHQFVELNVKAYVDYLEDTILVLTERLNTKLPEQINSGKLSTEIMNAMELISTKENTLYELQRNLDQARKCLARANAIINANPFQI